MSAELDVRCRCSDNFACRLPTVAWLHNLHGPVTSECHRQSRTTARPTSCSKGWALIRSTVAATLEARPDPGAHAALWWILERAYHGPASHHGMPLAGGPRWRRGRAYPCTPVRSAGTIFVWVCRRDLASVRDSPSIRTRPTISWASLAEGRSASRVKLGGPDHVMTPEAVSRGGGRRLACEVGEASTVSAGLAIPSGRSRRPAPARQGDGPPGSPLAPIFGAQRKGGLEQ